ncbi:hypothetical protein TorRG33x02_254650 [Trema orientale]|uniref:Transmembrane protein n=1 Tax=Trema orientale TaxID=63057 RepID=A0A2P5DDM3_TREOI|nr:hypothetical protein TorRG33x02_254650 [Trema orientale]
MHKRGLGLSRLSTALALVLIPFLLHL